MQSVHANRERNRFAPAESRRLIRKQSRPPGISKFHAVKRKKKITQYILVCAHCFASARPWEALLRERVSHVSVRRTALQAAVWAASRAEAACRHAGEGQSDSVRGKFQAPALCSRFQDFLFFSFVCCTRKLFSPLSQRNQRIISR